MTASCNIVLLMHVQSMMLTSTCPVRPCIWSVLGIWSKPCSAVSITAAFRHHGHELLTDSSSHKFPMLSCTIKSYAVLADMPSMVSSSPCTTTYISIYTSKLLHRTYNHVPTTQPSQHSLAKQLLHTSSSAIGSTTLHAAPYRKALAVVLTQRKTSYAVLMSISSCQQHTCPTSSKAPHRCGLSDAIVIPSTPAPCAVSMGSLYTSVPKQSGIHCQCR